MRISGDARGCVGCSSTGPLPVAGSDLVGCHVADRRPVIFLAGSRRHRARVAMAKRAIVSTTPSATSMRTVVSSHLDEGPVDAAERFDVVTGLQAATSAACAVWRFCWGRTIKAQKTGMRMIVRRTAGNEGSVQVRERASGTLPARRWPD